MIEIPARQGKAIRVRKGQTVKVVNTRGQQVVDAWAFNADDMREFMSMEHSRVAIGRIIPGIGDTLVTNKRRAILTLVEDTSGGIHDTLFAACDRWRYETLGCTELSRQLHRQSRGRARRTRTGTAGNAVAIEPVHEHPGHRWQPGRNAAPGQHPRQPCGIARRDGLRCRILRLPAGFAADQWHRNAADRSAFRGIGLKASINHPARPSRSRDGRLTLCDINRAVAFRVDRQSTI